MGSLRVSSIVFSLFLVLSLSVPAHADVLEFKTEKESYSTDEVIKFTGKSAPFDMVQISFRDSEGNFKGLLPVVSQQDGTFEREVEIQDSGLFTSFGIYNVSAFGQTQPAKSALYVLLDYTANGITVAESKSELKLNPIGSLQVNEGTQISFTATLAEPDSTNKTLSFSLDKNPPTGATIGTTTGIFTWTPTKSQGPGTYNFDIRVSDGTSEGRESITITVLEVADTPKQEPKPEPKPEPEPVSNVPDFIEPEKGVQYYLDRYNNEPAYKEWFDKFYPDYTIEEAIELAIPGSFSKSEPKPEPKSGVPDFIDPKKGAQYYLDRYNNEPAYKSWFDKNFPDYTIKEAIELAIPGSFPEPEETKPILPFVDPKQDPQYYIDRYNSESSYKEWFDENFPDYTIYEAVGVEPPEPPKVGICGKGTQFVDGECIAVTQGGGCLIATAAYGSEMAPQVQFLREIRDSTVLNTSSGSAFLAGFNEFYYSFSPIIADWERENSVFKEAVKITILPLLASLSILNLVDIDSEEEMLGYGIGIILLNLGIYFVTPAIIIGKALQYYKSRK